MDPILVQGIGFLGLLFVALSFQINKRRHMLLLILIGAVLFSVHFGLLAAWTAVAMNLISGFRAYFFRLRETNKWADKQYWMFVFILIFWVAGLLVWEGPRSLLIILGMTIESFSLWNKNTKYLRYVFLSARPLFISYNFIVGSIAGNVTELFIISSVVMGILRFDTRKQAL